MERRVLEVLGCPDCGLPFTEVSHAPGTIEIEILTCDHGHEFAVSDGVPMLVRQSDRSRLLAFADSYGRAWAKDGWGSPDTAYLEGLPYRDNTGRRSGEWRVKARSMEALLGVLNPQKWRRVIDLGCGNGWLSHHLAIRGHDVYAVDAVLDNTVGLGAAGTYARMGPPFQRIWGDLEHLPFQSSSVDAVVCNASLHYARDMPASLVDITRVLRPGGLLAILNSPVYVRPASAARALSKFRAHLRNLGLADEAVLCYHHLSRSELESQVGTLIGAVNEIPFDAGWWFRWSRRLKGVALRMELASFPILTASKRDVATPV